ncbi:chondroitinase family polysaccharide lyase [Paraglaciecola sp. L3A3]|uniref:chondroitinase family polysaccharide lyase n=1 Tax=Paraglaciecola sp. L3A3 TaxID=2686358 RepID=UPI00131E4F5F|nr:chondroitinase family polysaccharide lyase [Paraglaciecola sp. L3A3]
MKHIFKRLAGVVLAVGVTATAHGAETLEYPIKVMESFEQGLPDYWSITGKNYSLDNKRMKHGTHSLKWNWQGNDSITVHTPIGYRKPIDLSKAPSTGRFQYLKNGHSSYESKEVLETPRGFFMWIYNDKATTQRLSFEFGRGAEVDVEFDFNLDFVGWRTVSVNYDRGDMQGVPHPDMDTLTIRAPATGAGTFYLDTVGLSVPVNPKTVGPNPQLPNLDPHERLVSNYDHKMLMFHGYKPTFQLKPLTKDSLAQVNNLTAKAEQFIFPDYEREAQSKKSISSITKKFNEFEIKREGEQIFGKPLVKTSLFPEYFVETGLGKKLNASVMEWRWDFNNLLLSMAKQYQVAKSTKDKEQLEKMFIDLFDYGIDQGFAEGAGLGWIHHYAYEIREVAPAFLLMRDVLARHNRLGQAIATMKWFYGFGQVYSEDVVYGVKGRKAADADDTQGFLLPRLYMALAMENSAEKVRDLEHYASYFANVTTAYAPALDEVFKADGLTFHHGGHSQGYGGRAVKAAAAVMYLLKDTPFAVEDEVFGRMRKITNTLFDTLFGKQYIGARAFTNTRFTNYEFPANMYDLPALIALSAPTFDAEMAGLYQELYTNNKKNDAFHDYWLNKLKQAGDIGEYHYAPSRVLPYSALATIRDDNNWMATVRGHSKYVYPYESWGWFAYPTFIGYGYLDVSYPNHLDSTQADNKTTWHAGYDWHRWPGVTSVNVPYAQIQTHPGQVKDEGGEYPFSDQAFVGGAESTLGNAVFTFPFKGHDVFGLQSFTGIKSYFLFEDFIVALGSDIKSDIAQHAVETTILQNPFNKGDSKSGSQFMSNQLDEKTFPYVNKISDSEPLWLVDSRQTGYYIPQIPQGSELLMQRTEQTNPDYKNIEAVKGNFTTLLFDHGIKPNNAHYEYVVMPNSSSADMQDFAKAMQQKNNQHPYRVLQQDKRAHIVQSPEKSTTAYAVFDAQTILPKTVVTRVNRPATFIVKETSQGIQLAVADPDLNIYDGQDDLMPDGSRVELSIYNHEWFFWPSRSSKVQLTLSGEWKISQQVKEIETVERKKATIIKASETETIIEFECKDGLTAEVLLSKVTR